VLNNKRAGMNSGNSSADRPSNSTKWNSTTTTQSTIASSTGLLSCAEAEAQSSFLAPKWYPGQRTWVANPRKPENAAYNFPLTLRFRGALDRDALEWSLNQLVRRHEVLRSVFRFEEGRLLQTVLPPRTLSVAEIDLQDSQAEPSEPRIQQLLARQAAAPFDLRRDLLLRATLIRIGAVDHVLLLLTHHIACDDWSAGILLHELSLLYNACAASRPEPLSLTSSSYSEFTRQLTGRMRGPAWEAEIQFWKDRLSGGGDFHHVPPDTPRPNEMSFAGAYETIAISAELSRRLRIVGQQEQLSPFMILTAALQCSLARYSGAEDVGVAACTANRSRTEFEGTVGPFSNRIVLRTDLRGNPTFRELLHRVRNVALDAYSHQDVPFGEIVEAVGGANDASTNRLFQTLIVMRDATRKHWEFSGLEAIWFPYKAPTTRYDLNLWLAPGEADGLQATLQYDRDLFRAPTIQSLLQDYGNVLERIARDAGQRIDNRMAGHPDRWRKATEHSVHPAGTRPTEPRDQFETQLQEIWQELLKQSPIGIRENYFDLGGDSIQAARLFGRVEEVFGVTLPVSTLLQAGTIAKLAGILRGSERRAQWSSLVPIVTSGLGPPLFCVHNHTGDILYCKHLHDYLGTERPLYGFQCGCLNGKSPHRSVNGMARSYVEEMRDVQPHGPYHLFGYSFGGYVAFEMARELTAAGERVNFLGMFNTPAPGSLEGWPLRQPSYLRNRIWNEWRKVDVLSWRWKLRHIAGNAWNFNRMVVRSAKTDAWRFASNSMGETAAAHLAEQMVAIEHINIAAAKNYRPGAVFPGQLTFFTSSEIPYLYSIAPEPGWKTFARDGVAVVEILKTDGETSWHAFARTVCTQSAKRAEMWQSPAHQ
jgi:thioesterase domain-containing protein/acyl carrier protein